MTVTYLVLVVAGIIAIDIAQYQQEKEDRK